MLRLDTWNLWSSQGNCSLPGVSSLLFCSGWIPGTSGAPKGIVHCQEYKLAKGWVAKLAEEWLSKLEAGWLVKLPEGWLAMLAKGWVA